MDKNISRGLYGGWEPFFQKNVKGHTLKNPSASRFLSGMTFKGDLRNTKEDFLQMSNI